MNIESCARKLRTVVPRIQNDVFACVLFDRLDRIEALQMFRKIELILRYSVDMPFPFDDASSQVFERDTWEVNPLDPCLLQPLASIRRGDRHEIF